MTDNEKKENRNGNQNNISMELKKCLLTKFVSLIEFEKEICHIENC